MQFDREKLDRGCSALGLSLGEGQVRQLRQYSRLLAKWSRRLNLTTIRAEDDIVVQHVLDSLSIHGFVSGPAVLDIGSGAGVPGLPLAIARPELNVTLLDSRSRRIEFLRHVIINTGIRNVALVNGRVESYRPPDKFDTLTARAVSSLDRLLKLSKTHLLPGTRLISLKGRLPETEMERLPATLRTRASIHKVVVPFLEAERNLIVIDF
ncbi:MAG: 16S rRNA (guanine(527)-N(7))-methyltransferase RsmG [Gammaproteobacteria bacterium]|nr:16S rRNA (guanine(527)-N(7))-methyltransferase RsmG [Gammaproteobacteria bacterium]